MRRREILKTTALAAAAGVLPVAAFAAVKEDVSPPEDLMREHGVLKRVMLVYDEVLRRWAAREDAPAKALADAAGIIRSFVEDYHEKLEEEHLFPRFEKAGRLVELVRTLRAQHEAGRVLTEAILREAKGPALATAEGRERAAEAMRRFNRMYAPHEAREDTVLFPAFRELLPPRELDALGEQFERKEDQLFGDEGFERVVGRVAEIEKTLGIYDLAQFTPKV